jgi:hypothetical protein
MATACLIPLLIIGWISVKYSIRQAVAIYINQHRIFANKQTVGFNNGKQWQTNLGGNENWKNRPTHSKI